MKVNIENQGDAFEELQKMKSHFKGKYQLLLNHVTLLNTRTADVVRAIYFNFFDIVWPCQTANQSRQHTLPFVSFSSLREICVLFFS